MISLLKSDSEGVVMGVSFATNITLLWSGIVLSGNRWVLLYHFVSAERGLGILIY